VAWKDVPEDVREQAERVLTERQLETLKLRTAGLSWRRIADAYNCTPEAVRGCHDRATLKLRRSLEDA
jgi:transcriptional regulator